MRIVEFDTTPFYLLPFATSGSGGQVRQSQLPFHRATATGLSAGPLIFAADLQGRVNGVLLGVALAEELRILIELGEIKQPKGIALAGDLYDHPELQKLGASGDVAEVYAAMNQIAPVIGVLGNHDRMKCPPDGTKVLESETAEWAGLSVGGVGGIIGNSSRPMRKTTATFQVELNRVLAKRPDLLMLHQGPPGNCDEQIGSEDIKKMLPQSRELFLVCGHCHWTTPLSEHGRLQVMNVDSRVVVVSPILT